MESSNWGVTVEVRSGVLRSKCNYGNPLLYIKLHAILVSIGHLARIGGWGSASLSPSSGVPASSCQTIFYKALLHFSLMYLSFVDYKGIS